MNFQFMLAKLVESGFSLFLERLFLYFYQFFSANARKQRVFSAFEYEPKVHGQRFENLLL